MKQTPQEKKIQPNFESGKISKDGFLGSDNRHIHDIIQADQLILNRLNVSLNDIADRLQFFIEQGKKGLEGRVDLGDYVVQLTWGRGKLPCPFGEPELHNKIIAIVFNKKSAKIIKYSQLSVHMIREHGFFEGKGSPFRLEPEELVRTL